MLAALDVVDTLNTVALLEVVAHYPCLHGADPRLSHKLFPGFELIYSTVSKSQRISLSEDIPANHSAGFAPVIMPTLQIGLDAYAVAALTWLAK